MKIKIGNTKDGHAIALDLDTLLTTRLLIQANSGAGKSWLLRRLIEQFYGHVQVIVIDPEGEFATLREKYDFVLAAKNGDTPADVRSAAMLAEKLLELRASAVCDLYEMKPGERHAWVKAFLDAMVDAPKKLWHPCIVIVDEAQMFCPQDSDSIAEEAMVSLTTRGRKRGFCAIWATQRLAKVNKDATSMLLNRLVGGTFEDVDIKRALDLLSVSPENKLAVSHQLKTMDPGWFFAFGRAVAKERVLLKVGDVQTTHPKPGSAKHAAEPPPAPEKIRGLLPKLGDLPKAAEEKARTLQDLQAKVRSLTSELSAARRERSAPTIDTAAMEKAVMAAIIKRDRQWSAAAEDFRKSIMQALLEIVRSASLIEPPKEKEVASLPKVLAPKRIGMADELDKYMAATSTPATRSTPTPAAEGELAKGERATLIAIAQSLEGATPEQLTIVTGYKRSTRNTYLQRLGQSGYIVRNGDGRIHATDIGITALGSGYEPLPTGDALREHWMRELPEGERKILEAICEVYPETMDREKLSELTGYTRSSRNTYLQRLGARELVETFKGGAVKAADLLFDMSEVA